MKVPALPSDRSYLVLIPEETVPLIHDWLEIHLPDFPREEAEAQVRHDMDTYAEYLFLGFPIYSENHVHVDSGREWEELAWEHGLIDMRRTP